MRTHLCLLVFCLLLPITWNIQELFLPKMKKFTTRLANQFLDTQFPSTRKKIVLIHNYYRSRVNPPAANMLEMKWHKGAQALAQKWADQCQYLVHDETQLRRVPNYGICGQNLYVSTVRKDWLTVTKDWFDERNNFVYGGNNDLENVGHYTQMVWFNTYRVGCAFAFCNTGSEPFYNYVCNYCPIGNDQYSFSTPYLSGPSCDKCPDDCKYERLCTKTCRYTNLWSNCQDLKTTHADWLCGDRKGEAFKNCQATCRCSNVDR